MKRWMGLVLVLAAMQAACAKQRPAVSSAAQEPGQTSRASDRVELRVAMFPWIPDSGKDQFAAYLGWVEEKFELENPHVDLQLASMEKGSSMFYKSSAVDEALQGDFDVIEIDTILLSEVVAMGHVAPLSAPLPDEVHPAARQSVTLSRSGQEQQWGYPHWLCSHFLLTRDDGAAQATSAADLAARLQEVETGQYDLLSDWSGSWGFGAHYLTADATLRGVSATTSLADYLEDGLHPESVEALRVLGQACPTGEDSHSDCADGTYAWSDEPAELFGRGEAEAVAGYSERLWVVLDAGASPDEIRVSQLPIGGPGLFLYTDAFVTSTKCRDECRSAAQAFSQFMFRADVMETLLLSKETESAEHPRYLLPSNLATYDRGGLQQDPFYPTLRQLTSEAEAFPNQGFEANRKALQAALRAALGIPAEE